MENSNQKIQDNGEFELVKAAQAGDTAALRELVQKYEDTGFGFAFKVCRNQDDAEGTLQEAFLNFNPKEKIAKLLPFSIFTFPNPAEPEPKRGFII